MSEERDLRLAVLIDADNASRTAMRDVMAGDMVAGISKAAEALLIGAAIALGTALALGLTRMVTGGAL